MFVLLKKIAASIRGNAVNYKKLNALYSKAMDDRKNVKMNLGQLQAYLNNQKQSISNLFEIEFQIFSQGGEDGILQYLIAKIAIPNKTFIEFGVENYTESNTRYLFLNNNWSGYVIDGSAESIRFLEHDVGSIGELHFQCAFITVENINELLQRPRFDYWIWEAIDKVKPVITIVEYNSVFGVNTFWSVPYDEKFVRRQKHSSQLYYGASLKALCHLAERKGYRFIGCNSRGNNAFFLHNDVATDFMAPTTADSGYVLSKFREARDEHTWITGPDRIKAIAGLEVVDVRTGEIVKIDPNDVRYK